MNSHSTLLRKAFRPSLSRDILIWDCTCSRFVMVALSVAVQNVESQVTQVIPDDCLLLVSPAFQILVEALGNGLYQLLRGQLGKYLLQVNPVLLPCYHRRYSFL